MWNNILNVMCFYPALVYLNVCPFSTPCLRKIARVVLDNPSNTHFVNYQMESSKSLLAPLSPVSGGASSPHLFSLHSFNHFIYQLLKSPRTLYFKRALKMILSNSHSSQRKLRPKMFFSIQAYIINW